MPAPPYVKKQKDLATRLGVSPPLVTRLKAQAWWPPKTSEGWCVSECAAAYAAFQRGEHEVDYAASSKRVKAAKPDPAPAPRRAAPPPPRDPECPEGMPEGEWASILVLRDASSAPVELARAAAALSAHELARGRCAGEGLSAKSVSALKTALEELRRTEQAHEDAEKEAGRLLPREVLEAVCGSLGRLLLQGLEQWSSDVATKVQLWVADEEFRALRPEAQRAAVQEWSRKSQRELREVLADGLSELVDEEWAA